MAATAPPPAPDTPAPSKKDDGAQAAVEDFPLHRKRRAQRQPQFRRPQSKKVAKHSLAWTKFRELCDAAKTDEERKELQEKLAAAEYMEEARYTDARERDWKVRYLCLMDLVRKSGKASRVTDDVLLRMCDESDCLIGDLLHACVDFECPIPECIGLLYNEVQGGPRLGGHHVAREIVEELRLSGTEELNICRVETARELIKWHAIVCDDFDFDNYDDLQVPFMVVSLVIVLLTLSVPLLTTYWGHGLDGLIPAFEVPQFVTAITAA